MRSKHTSCERAVLYLDFNDVLLVSLDLVQINGTKNKYI